MCPDLNAYADAGVNLEGRRGGECHSSLPTHLDLGGKSGTSRASLSFSGALGENSSVRNSGLLQICGSILQMSIMAERTITYSHQVATAPSHSFGNFFYFYSSFNREDT